MVNERQLHENADRQLRMQACAILKDGVLHFEMKRVLLDHLSIPNSIVEIILKAALKELTEPRLPVVGRF